MTGWIERVLRRWLRAVAPREWSDSVLGDLQEETGAGRQSLVPIAGVAVRFTVDVVMAAWEARHRGGNMSGVFTDARHALRSLRQGPAFAAVAILTLALAIGANTAIYSALSSLVLRPLAFPDGGRHVFIWYKNPAMGELLLTPPLSAVERWRTANHIFDAIESYTSRTAVILDNGEPETLNLTRIRPTTLRTIGVSPMIGRPIVDADAAANAPPVVLISHALWTNRFGRDADIVGRPLRLDETTYTIIGVMPRRFELPMSGDTLWTAARAGGNQTDRENTLARLAPGVTVEQAQAALDAMGDPGGDYKGWVGQILTPSESNGTQIRTALMVLTGAVGLLLLIACVNVANLVLSRHVGRRRELAMRHALGASRARLARLLFIESTLVAGAGGLLGLVVAYGSLEAMAALRPASLDVLARVELDGAALGVAAAASVLTALLCGVAPALAESRVRLQDVLASGGRAATPAGQHARWILTAAQVALALMLLVGASLLLRSYARLTAVDPGYNPEGVLAVAVSLPSGRYQNRQRQAFFDGALAAVRSLPGVVSAAVGSGVPPDTSVTFGELDVQGRPADEAKPGIFSGGSVSPDYFATLGIPVLQGRAFTAEDGPDRDRVAVVGESFAKQYFPDGDAVGRRFRMQSDGPWSTIVGVVGDVKALSLAADAGRLQFYHARAQLRPAHGAIITRAVGDPMALVPAIKAKIWALDSRLPIGDIATAHQSLSRSIGQTRFNLALLAAFATCGFVLAVVGVHGVTAIFVGQRRREVGIRMALGATRGAVAMLVARQTTIVLAAGIATGLIGGAWLSRYMRELVFQVGTTDPASFAGPAVALAAAGCVATIVPLRRAMTVDPASVLRSE